MLDEQLQTPLHHIPNISIYINYMYRNQYTLIISIYILAYQYIYHIPNIIYIKDIIFALSKILLLQ